MKTEQTLPKLWQHQANAIAMAAEKDGSGQYVRPDFALFMEAGTGKSRTLIEILLERYETADRIMRTIVFAPLAVCENLRREFALYSDIDQNFIGVYNMNGPKRKKLLYEDIKKGTKKILIINYEAVLSAEILHLLHTFQPEIGVCDESHRLKSHNAKRSTAIYKLLKPCKYRFLLTGTPALKNQMDLFMQFKILDTGKTFGENFWAFRSHFFEDKNARWAGKQSYFPDFRIKANAMLELEKRVKQKSFSVLKSECLDLPDLVPVPIHVELSREQRRLYDSMKRDFVAFIAGKKETDEPKAVVATQAMTKLLRLQQIVSGFAVTETGEIIETKENPRLDALRDIVLDITPDHKLIVWCCFTHNYKMIGQLLEKLKIKHVFVTGEQSVKEKQQAIDQFQTDTETRVMVANQRAGGIGINLTSASYSVYYSKNFSLEDDEQSQARNYRGGSEIHDKVTRIDLVATDTIDTLINESLKEKKQVLFEILDWENI